jgi:3-deoxy-D-manno-octulosonic-acid transferase
MINALGYIAYQAGVWGYTLLVNIAALFNGKAALFINGRKGLLDHIELVVAHDKRSKIWFHCASLGEFEQARPVIEQLRSSHPTHAIVITFFSPSGYEIRKNYAGADYIFYLPLDTPQNAKRFVLAINPVLVFFVKYEIWYHYLKALHSNKIPVVLISANFRPNHIYFKSYGTFFKKMLFLFEHIFCQNEASFDLLHANGINRTSISKDTRFDRVFAHSKQALQIAPAEDFTNNHNVLIAGSSYEPEEEMIAEVMRHFPEWKIIIAPHHIAHQRIESIQKRFAAYGVTTFSELSLHPHQSDRRVLIMDNIGMLSSLYQYADIAFIGGGFGNTGLHNTLEAAVFGMPILFGPNNHKKFPEALDMIKAGVGFSISHHQQLEALLHEWDQSPANQELLQLLNLEKSLVYFTTSLKSNEVMMYRLQRLSMPALQNNLDEDLMEDVVTETKQAIEMANIYSNILGNMMGAHSSIISNNLNITIRFLTSVTIILSLPILVASLYGMNVELPFEHHPHAFWIVMSLAVILSVIGVLFFRKKNLF